MKDVIRVSGARQHNLKNLTVEIPRRALTVVTGPSGSGKSTLAFDTIYAEGQRRYVESLSAYARQFLERMEKPEVDSIDGLSPAVAIEQKNPTRTSRSTVGTATEIYDYLRLLWARVGHTICPECGREISPDIPESAAERILALPERTRFTVAFPLRLSQRVTHQVVVENLRAQGFVRVAADGRVMHLDDLDPTSTDLTEAAELLVVVDRLSASAEQRGRITDALATAFAEGDGDAVVLLAEPVECVEGVVGGGRSGARTGAREASSDASAGSRRAREAASDASAGSRRAREAQAGGKLIERLVFTEHFRCPVDGHSAPAPTPQLFSFNNPRGACTTCNGFGAVLDYDERLIVPYPERTLRDGAIDPWTKPRYESRRRMLAEFAASQGIDLDTPWANLTSEQRELLLNRKGRGYTGIFPFLRSLEEKRYKQYIRVFLRQYQSARQCDSCGGSKLKPEALQVHIGEQSIAWASELPVEALLAWLESVDLSPSETAIADHILREVRSRVGFLCDVGLTYLTLNRGTRTLSGGEAQRIGLANSLGSHLVDTLYVLDEPSIGLHPRDTDRLLRLLHKLRDSGNTVVVVEHDPDTIRRADYMLELGPGSGERGGELVFAGPIARVAESPLTGQYLTGARSIPVPERRRRLGALWLTLTNARENNLQGVDVRVPLGALTVVTGVSGSGKSTLVHDVLYRALETRLTGEHSARQHLGERVGEYDQLTGAEALDAVVLIDQEPIGRSPRSNPVTYVKAFDEIRRIFAAEPLARERGYTAGTFSFNVAGGRCDQCEGAGHLQVEMVFMADIFVPCEVCGGSRYRQEVLDVTVRGKRITDVLNMTVDQAIRFFPREEKLGQALWHVQQVGLGYLRLGQPATTLSGGEAQRLKIARELALGARGAGRKLYVMDEPTTGLHLEDIRKLAEVMDRLISNGHTVLLIEHNLDVIKLADWIIDLGPEAGAGGGAVVAMGRPEDVMRVDASHTGKWLRTVLSDTPREPTDAPDVDTPARLRRVKPGKGRVRRAG